MWFPKMGTNVAGLWSGGIAVSKTSRSDGRPVVDAWSPGSRLPFGFRKAELLGMRCSQVDLLNNTIFLYSGETKNGESRTVTLTNECRNLVMELRRGKQLDDFLFTRGKNEPIRDFRGAWEVLINAAGVSGFCFTTCAVRLGRIWFA